MSELLDYSAYEAGITQAEQDCLTKVCEILGLQTGRSAFLAVNAGVADCAVLDVGYPESGDVLSFPANTFHFRGQLDLYNRDRKRLQVWLARMVAATPITDGTMSGGRGDKMPDDSNVRCFRIAPQTNAISAITTNTMKVGNSATEISTFTASIALDIVFSVNQ